MPPHKLSYFFSLWNVPHPGFLSLALSNDVTELSLHPWYLLTNSKLGDLGSGKDISQMVLCVMKHVPVSHLFFNVKIDIDN